MTNEAIATRVDTNSTADGYMEYDATREHFVIGKDEYEIHYKLLINEKTNYINTTYEIIKINYA